jgi:glycosyltransferase involved in cell wall biosynthesis
VLLEVWPRIRKRVPDAELHVFYGWNVFDAVARSNPALYAYKAKILSMIEKCGGEEGGIFMRGRVGQKELADEMMQARVLSYPTAFLETSCITAMEAKAAGLPIVTSDLGGLHESAAGQVLIPWRADNASTVDEFEATPVNASDEYQAEFVERVVMMLSNEAAWTARHDLALSGATENTWENRIADWTALVPAVTKKAKTLSRKRRARVAA